MRHLVVCCDGTWNTPEQESATNVFRLYNALAKAAADGVKQVPYYQGGVGTAGGLLDRLLGGVTGVGLSRNVMDAYRWLTITYRPGDHIALFGFSRGAYTVRSLAGMIARCGLIDTAGLDEATVWHRIKHLYQHRYRARGSADPGWRAGLSFSYDPEHADQIPVHFIGVWDTVGSLGIPDHLGWLNLLDPPRRHDFHNVELNPHVRHARHAVAMDERRGPFTPTLWSTPAPGQDVKQVWFPGSHLDVGGGHAETGLSDGALQWMIEQARDAAGLAFHQKITDQIRPDALDVLHDDNRSAFGRLGHALEPLLEPFFAPRPRAVPRIDPHVPGPLHESVYERHQNHTFTGAPYRPTSVLAVGGSTTVTVSAHEPWNETGLYLTAGHYTFVAEGEWRDRNIRSGPAGTTGLRRFLPLEVRRPVGTLSGQAETLFRRMTRNEVAGFLFSRREEDQPWMSLIGVVANDAESVGSPDDERKQHERIIIGAGADHTVKIGGYLYAFANDAWGSYRKNQGNVRLTVTRTA